MAHARVLSEQPVDAPPLAGCRVAKPVDVLRRDLAAAGIPYDTESPEGRPLFADFHALRHSFLALLDCSGATLREAMQLARHSDPKLTLPVHGRTQLNELTEAVDGLSSVFTKSSPADRTAAVPGIGREG